MLLYVTAFACSFLNIGLRSWQQLNVIHRKYWWIVPTSMLMALCEALILFKLVNNGFGWVVVAIGLGGGLGSVCSTMLHSKLTNKEKKNVKI